MNSNVKYYESQGTLLNDIKQTIEVHSNHELLVSGAWSKSIYEEMIQAVLGCDSFNSCKVIIPQIRVTGSIPLSLIKKICSKGSDVRVNSRFNNNLLVINDLAFILSFSGRIGKASDVISTFECALVTNESSVVSQIKNIFETAFSRSVAFRG